MDGEEEREGCILVFYGSDPEVVNITVVTFRCPQFNHWVAHTCKGAGKCGWQCALEEKGNDFENHPLVSATDSWIMNMKLLLSIILWKEKRAPLTPLD